MTSKAFEDYLKIIYKLEESLPENADKGVSTTAIAERLAISKASVSNMLKKLADKALIRYEPYYGVMLTEEGNKIALNMIRKHRILEQYLVEKLGYSWDEVDAEAEVLEHAVSNRLTNRMWDALGRPTRDPHGSPIPNEEGEMSGESGESLSDVTVGVLKTVVRIQNRTPEELRYLSAIGLTRNAKVKVHEKAPFDGPLSVEVGGDSHALDFRLAQSIFVR
ncbi:metal-dependent transcriptional regulator [Hydrogenovibrio sp. JE_KL2]|uniref:metal-dependent transcriptional regulator n=1 Tax=Hydrogenovibrio sp. JE_KL2 TaxID=2651188 RepID=UPI00128B1DEC|nr:metal-dependent transcriptional regulator [Hydrogenovibrio sp. JE_KL2]MPQ75725.1 metal-dependent transcriptional regulator [Hydrogenovibrio sp. JE_KL2]